MKSKLQPLPRKVNTPETNVTHSTEITSTKENRQSHTAPDRPIVCAKLIEPRRIAIKFESQTLVLEYKEAETGKLRHRSFHIDIDRFQDATACTQKLWRRLSKTVVPGSVSANQLLRLVKSLFDHEKSRSPDLGKLDADADRLLASKLKFDVSGVDIHTAKGNSHEGYGAERSHRLRTVHEDSGKGEDDARTNETENKDRDTCFKAEKTGVADSLAPTNRAGSAAEPKEAVENKESGRKDGRGLSFALAPLPKLASGKLIDSSLSSPPQSAASKPAGQADSPVSPGGGPKLSKGGGESLDKSDIDEEIDYDDDFEDLADAEEAPEPAARSGSSGEERQRAEAEAAAAAEALRLMGDDVDLNGLDKEELDRYKALMEVDFAKHAILPGDPRYRHDVQVEFAPPEEDAGWDEEDDDAE